MNRLRVLVLGMVTALISLGGFGSPNALAQQSAGAGQSTEKLPADVYADTYSRMPRAKKENFTHEEEKQAFDRLLADGFDKRESGGTLIRGQLPIIADLFSTTLIALRDKRGLEISGLKESEAEVAILTALRELAEPYEWVGHERTALRVGVPQQTVDVIKYNRFTSGLPERDETIIRFGRELYRGARKVSSKTFADMERLFGRKGTLNLTVLMMYYTANDVLFRAYDQRVPPTRGAQPFPIP